MKFKQNSPGAHVQEFLWDLQLRVELVVGHMNVQIT